MNSHLRLNIPADNPCKPDCIERSAICHCNCKRYDDFRAKLNEASAKRIKDRVSIQPIPTYEPLFSAKLHKSKLKTKIIY